MTSIGMMPQWVTCYPCRLRWVHGSTTGSVQGSRASNQTRSPFPPLHVSATLPAPSLMAPLYPPPCFPCKICVSYLPLTRNGGETVITVYAILGRTGT